MIVASSVRHGSVVLDEQPGVALDVDRLHHRNTREVFIQDPPGLGSAASDVDGDPVVDRELEQLRERRLPVGLDVLADVGLDQGGRVERQNDPDVG